MKLNLGRLKHGLLKTAIASWIILNAPSIAEACSVCTAGRDEENQTAFLLSTLFMSLLPLAALGTLVFVLWRRIKKLEEQDGLGLPRETAGQEASSVSSSVESSIAATQAKMRSEQQVPRIA